MPDKDQTDPSEDGNRARDGQDGAEAAPKPRRPFDRGFGVVAALAVASGAGVWVTKGPETFLRIFFEDLGFAAELLPKIAGGIILATALGLALPRDKVLRLVGPDSGIPGLVIAALAGALLPGGPAVTYPLTASLMAAGADLAAAVSLVTGWVLLSLNRTLVWELSFLPHDLVLLRVLITLPVPVLLGLALRWLRRRQEARS